MQKMKRQSLENEPFKCYSTHDSSPLIIVISLNHQKYHGFNASNTRRVIVDYMYTFDTLQSKKCLSNCHLHVPIQKQPWVKVDAEIKYENSNYIQFQCQISRFLVCSPLHNTTRWTIPCAITGVYIKRQKKGITILTNCHFWLFSQFTMNIYNERKQYLFELKTHEVLILVLNI